MSNDTAQASLRWLFLHCCDLGAMRRFYSELLGLPETAFKDEGEANWLCYRCGTLDIVIMRHADAAIAPGWAEQPGWSGGTTPQASWAVLIPEERFAAAVSALAAAGVEAFLDQPGWQQDSYWSFPVRDPMGNTVEIYCEPRVRPQSTAWPGT